MIYLIAIEPTVELSGVAIGFLETDAQYIQFYADAGGVTLHDGFDKLKYRSYEHFAGVVGKFNPDVIFSKNKVELTDLTKEAIAKAITMLFKDDD